MADPLDDRIAQLQKELSTAVEPVQVSAPSLANAPMQSAGGDANLDAQIAALQAHLANTNPQMSGAEDIGRSAVSGLNQGVAGAVGQFGDAAKAGTSAAEWLLQQGGHALGVPDNRLQGFDPHAPAVTSADMSALIQNKTGPYHEPQTVPGQYARTISSFLPAAAGGNGAIMRAALPVVSGAASEAAGQATHDLGPGWEHTARILAAMGGGGAVAGLQGLAKGGAGLVNDAAPALTNAQATQATDLMRHAESIGSPITVAEAVQQVTGGATNLGRMQRIVEGTKKGGAAMADLLSQRSPNARAAATRYADTIAAPTDQPSMIGVQAQQAAEGGLSKARQTVNSVAEPDYAALQTQAMPAEQYAAVSADPSYQKALADLRGNPELNAPIKGLPDNNMSVVNEVVKRVRELQATAKGTELVPGDNRLAALRGQSAGIADEAARAASPNYGAARDTVRDLSQEYVDPLKAGPLGAISRTADVPTQTGALYPSGPLAGAPAETAQAVRVLQGQNPQVPADLLRQHLLNALEGTSSDLTQGGVSPYAGFKYAKAIAGSPEQARTLGAGVTATSGQQAADELAKTLQVFQAHGMRQPAGSLTAQNLSDYADLGMSIPADLVKSANPLHAVKTIGNTIANAATKARVNQLVKVLKANPDEAQALLAQAMQQQGRAPGATGALLAGAIAGNGQ